MKIEEIIESKQKAQTEIEAILKKLIEDTKPNSINVDFSIVESHATHQPLVLFEIKLSY